MRCANQNYIRAFYKKMMNVEVVSVCEKMPTYLRGNWPDGSSVGILMGSLGELMLEFPLSGTVAVPWTLIHAYPNGRVYISVGEIGAHCILENVLGRRKHSPSELTNLLGSVLRRYVRRTDAFDGYLADVESIIKWYGDVINPVPLKFHGAIRNAPRRCKFKKGLA